MIAAGLWWLSGLPEGLRFWWACGRVAETQNAYLRRLVERNQGCDYFRHYGVSSLDRFGDLPIVEYSDLEPWITRMAAGQSNVLCREKVLLFEPTSGTTAEKLIPYTATLKAEFQRGVAAWVSNLYGRRPRLFGGKAYWAITPPPQRPRRTAGGLAIGFEDDASYLSGPASWLVRQMLAVPRPADLDETLKGLLHCPDLRLVSVWSPTLWLLLMEKLVREWHRWAALPALRSRLAGGPAEVWPQLDCISCWGDGASEAFLPALKAMFPRALVQPKGLLATEGFVSLPWLGQPGGLLALRCHFYEFLDESGQAFLAHQLRWGQRYQVLLTTGGGLYRYRLGDVVEVVGYYGQCPVLRFLGRVGGLSDRCGEKLSPEAVAAWLPPSSGPCFVAYEGDRYVLYCYHPEGAVERGEQLLLTFHHYRLCRELGQLKPLAGFRIEGDGWAQFYARMAALGRRAGDVKPLPLRLEDNWSQWFTGAFI